MGLHARKPDFAACKQQRADKPGHLCSLISTFVLCSLESIPINLAPCKTSIFQLASIAEQAVLSLTLEETSKTGFLALKPI